MKFMLVVLITMGSPVRRHGGVKMGIIMAPHHIVDYVVVHELCHLKHPNHSPNYWRFVKREIPDYDRCRQWLRVHEGELVI
jgi:predicted metal-dependent hydrolase